MQERFSRWRTRAKPTVTIYRWAIDRIDVFRIWVVLVLGTDGVHHTSSQQMQIRALCLLVPPAARQCCTRVLHRVPRRKASTLWPEFRSCAAVRTGKSSWAMGDPLLGNRECIKLASTATVRLEVGIGFKL
jgi:hypothetical protein